jgi:hypothetical protein
MQMEEPETQKKLFWADKRIDFNSPKAAPTLLSIGAVAWRVVAGIANVDFILSVREERLAMIFQGILDYGWIVLLIVGLVWLLQAHREPRKDMVHWGMVTVVGILTFMLGLLMTTYAAGTLPNIMQSWSGDLAAQTCSATIDTSRLVGLKNNYRVILICGLTDPTTDPLEDNRIAVSGAFHITGASVQILASIRSMLETFAKVTPPAPPNTTPSPNSGLPPNQAGAPNTAGPTNPPAQIAQINMWHAIAILPSGSDPNAIKRVSDVSRQGGRMITEPPAGGFGNVIIIGPPPQCPAPPPSPTLKLRPS